MKIEDIYKIENELKNELKGKHITLKELDKICTSYGGVRELDLKDCIIDGELYYLVPDDYLTYIETTFIIKFEIKKLNKDLSSSVVLVEEVK